MKGRTIRLYLVDGVPSGILTAEIINWTGKVVVAPRTRLADLAAREESRRTGVYLLVGDDPESPGKERVYIGEADNVYHRIKKHDGDESKDFFSRVAIVTSKDENLTKSHARYLESRMIALATSANRASVANGTAPTPPPMPESEKADMEYFLDQMRLTLPALGLFFLQPRASYNIASSAKADGPVVFELETSGALARMTESDNEYLVLRGSTARKQGIENWTNYRKLRDQLVAQGKLVDSANPDFYQFAEDVGFSSPSAAAAVVAGSAMNGRKRWRLPDGRTYGDWHDAQLQAAETEAADRQDTVPGQQIDPTIETDQLV